MKEIAKIASAIMIVIFFFICILLVIQSSDSLSTNYEQLILTDEKPIIFENTAYCISGAYALKYRTKEYKCYELKSN